MYGQHIFIVFLSAGPVITVKIVYGYLVICKSRSIHLGKTFFIMIILSLIFTLGLNSYFLLFLLLLRLPFYFLLLVNTYIYKSPELLFSWSVNATVSPDMLFRAIRYSDDVMWCAERGVAYSAVKSITTRTNIFVSSLKCQLSLL